MIFQSQNEKRISLVVAAILVTLTLGVGLSVYWTLRDHSETMFGRSLQLDLESRLRLIEYEVRQHLAKTVLLTNKPEISVQLENALRGHVFGAQETFAATLKSALGMGFRALIVYDRQGKQIASVGWPVQTKLALTLTLPQVTHLSWQDGYIVSTRMEIKRDGRKLGTVVAQTRIPEIDGISFPRWPLGRGMLTICSAFEQSSLRCIPTTASTPTKSSAIQPKALVAAMDLALRGNTGFTTRVKGTGGALTYMPMATLGLGAVFRVENAEAYPNVLKNSPFFVPLILLLMVSGGLLLRWQILPLMRKAQISEQQMRALNQQLLRNETRIRAVLDQVDEGIISISSAGIIRTLNPATERMFGYPEEEILGKNISVLMAEETFRHSQQWAENIKPELVAMMGSVREVAGRRKNGTIFPLELRLGEVKLEDEHLFIGSMRDISELKAVEKRLSHLANHDSLTNLPNRNLLQDRARQALAQAFRQGRMMGVLFLDLDHFKTTNDLMGHPVGDRLLQTVAVRLLNCVREEDTVARQGGDEFIVILPNIKRFEDIAIVAQKILVTLSTAYALDNTALHTSASIGVAVYPDDGKDVDTLMRNADTAMYYAKATGRNNFQCFTPKMNVAATERMSIENKLRYALGRDEFLLNYQPIVNIATGKVSAAEALLRWYPESGLIGPERFIPVAEETGLIVPIGEWVIRAALRERRRWLEQGLNSSRVVVNLSARQFAQKNLVATIGRILNEMELGPEHLGVEITESLIMDRPEDAVRTLRALSDMGVQVSVDDFGTGYSSLSYLKRFPLDKIKVDRSFIKDIATDQDDAAIVTAIIAMAHSLGATVVAEGVETEAQLNLLRAQGCDEFQGYYFSRPLPGNELFEKLRYGMPLLHNNQGKVLVETQRSL